MKSVKMAVKNKKKSYKKNIVLQKYFIVVHVSICYCIYICIHFVYCKHMICLKNKPYNPMVSTHVLTNCIWQEIIINESNFYCDVWIKHKNKTNELKNESSSTSKYILGWFVCKPSYNYVVFKVVILCCF